MNPDEFEEQLGRRRAPQLPPEWRAGILSVAESAREEQERSEVTAVGSRAHIRWAALAAVWVAIGLISTFDRTSDSHSAPAIAVAAPIEFEHRWQERLRLMAEWAEPPTPPPPAPVYRRRSGFHPVRLKTFA